MLKNKNFKIAFRALLIFPAFFAVNVVLAFTGPSSPPPAGAGGIVVDSSNRIGIGVSAPTAKLHVSSGGATDSLRVEASGIISLLVQNTTGNVGIGTANPSARLTIKPSNAGNVLVVQDTSGVNKFTVNDTGAISSGAISASSLLLTAPLGVAYGGTGLNSPGASSYVLTSDSASWVSLALPAGQRPDDPLPSLPSGSNTVNSPPCASPKKVTGGGCYNTVQCAITENAPIVPPGEWLCQWASTCSGGTRTAYVICE